VSGDAPGRMPEDDDPDLTGVPQPGRPAYTPTRRELFRPAELLGLSAIVGVVVGLTVLLSTREFEVAVVFAGLSFIVALVVFAMLALTAKPGTGDPGSPGRPGDHRPPRAGSGGH